MLASATETILSGAIDENPVFCGGTGPARCRVCRLCQQPSARSDGLQLELRLIPHGSLSHYRCGIPLRHRGHLHGALRESTSPAGTTRSRLRANECAGRGHLRISRALHLRVGALAIIDDRRMFGAAFRPARIAVWRARFRPAASRLLREAGPYRACAWRRRERTARTSP